MMKSFATLAVFASLAAQASATFMVNTPASVVQCQPVLLTWQDGTAPYYPTIIPGGQPSGAALKSFDQTSSTQLTWNVDIPAGTSITVAVRDSTGAQVFTDKVTITGSSASSCVDASGSASAGNASSGAATSTAASATGSASGAATSEGSSASSHGSGSSTSVPAAVATGTSSVASRISTTSSSARPSGSAGVSAASNGATVKGASMKAAGMAGVLGVIGAALL